LNEKLRSRFIRDQIADEQADHDGDPQRRR